MHPTHADYVCKRVNCYYLLVESEFDDINKNVNLVYKEDQGENNMEM